MPGILLTGDLHLTDAEEDLYRWDVFEVMLNWIRENAPCRVIIAGDLCDRKDRHSALLVNTIVAQLVEMQERGATIALMLGNHDKPLNGPAYWEILSNLNDIRFISEPRRGGTGILYLPYSDNPREDWNPEDLAWAHCIIMHQTVTGVMGNNGHELINDRMPELPTDIPIYSGDIHNPQDIEMENGAVVHYIGAPHPVKYGDTYPCRLLVLDDGTHAVKQIIALQPPQKHMLDVYSLEELNRATVRRGDSAKVRYFLTVNDINNWPLVLEDIKAWAAHKGVKLAAAEPVLEGAAPTAPSSTPDELLNSPASLLAAFLAEEGIAGELAAAGAAILEDTIRARASA